ncbi:hypothetical protein H310_11715 [Aphanomyces invadans]|uniref:Uncharacterized protein n=1 Tax=Aphanomyces invadans TaxID=157072 RepID=A0A024TL38_9STRA|nr:hypothetical protein H310_11715 [Aphanomyces invadans]ETV94753.1 hypothetical protein H310_11715 [Aphanomyces invadans]|eukprot:XP_008876698.1 hypothetical protein H310_11715 [Aphanomyces invadans]
MATVKFPSYADACRIKVDSANGDVPCKIWIENKVNKSQWSCVVTDTKDHAPKSASYVLPSTAEALVAVTTGGKVAKPATQGAAVDMTVGTKGHLELTLTMQAFAKLSAKYKFDLKPVEVSTTEKLEAKIRDLQDEVAALKESHDHAQFCTELVELRQNLRSRGYYSAGNMYKTTLKW